METEKKSEKEKDKADKAVNSLQEFIQRLGLVDWPVTVEEHVEMPAELFSFTDSQQIYEFLKEQVPFPSLVSESLLEQAEELYVRVKGHDARLSHTKSQDPAEESELITDLLTSD